MFRCDSLICYISQPSGKDTVGLGVLTSCPRSFLVTTTQFWKQVLNWKEARVQREDSNECMVLSDGVGWGSFRQSLPGTLEHHLIGLVKWALGRLYSFLPFSDI